jgi:hypothetical protein
MSDIPPHMRYSNVFPVKSSTTEAEWNELMRETLGKKQKEMQKVGKQELKDAIKTQKEWNKDLKEFVKINDKAAADLGKGFQDLNKATQTGLEEVGEKVEELAGLAKAAAPAITTLSNTLKGKTLVSQLKLTQALIDASQSEGVQGVIKFFTKLMNGLINGTTDLVKFGTNISNILGNFVNENINFEPFKAMFDQIDETSVKILEDVSAIIVSMITKITQYPAVFQVLADMIDAITGGLKAVETELLKFDAAVQAIDDWTTRMAGKFPALFSGYTVYDSEGGTVTGWTEDTTIIDIASTTPIIIDTSHPNIPIPKPLEEDHSDVGLTQ